MGAQVELIRQNSLRVTDDGFSFDVRLNWYRSLPLSSVDILSVKVDGEPVPSDKVYFVVNNHQYTQAELYEKIEELWFVQDFAGVRVRQPGKIRQGESHTIEAEISLRFPYMQIGPGKFLTNVTRCISAQTAQ
jgi:hypothetical protein